MVHGRLHPQGPGKDTITGHWELMGAITPVALRTYPDGFPEEILEQLIDGTGTDINYLVFNPKDPWAGKKAVRQAIAQLVDRAAIAHKVYKDTVDPLYSMVPKGLTGHTTGFFDDFGDPDADKAEEILRDAGITQLHAVFVGAAVAAAVAAVLGLVLLRQVRTDRTDVVRP